MPPPERDQSRIVPVQGQRPPARTTATRLGAIALTLVSLLGGPSRPARAKGPPARPSPQSEATATARASGFLQVSGRHFVDEGGRVVILRGVNLTGNAKVPPFDHGVGPVELDRLRDLGMNLIRLVLIWEAFEPSPGVYDEAYLASIQRIAALAWERGIYTIVDIHQDGFSRFASRGSGDGFPGWAVVGHRSTPDNGPGCRYWPLLMATDPTTYRSFRAFYTDSTGVRTRYLALLDRVAATLARTPGVIGYDPINEPWGDEKRELGPLYRDAAAALRARDPSAILFLEGHITTNSGIATRLEPPGFGNVAYAPHYYKPTTIALQSWGGSTRAIDHAFAAMTATAREWDCPLLVGEYGAGAGVRNGGDYVEALVERLDDALASGTQWNYTPLWTERDKDGWNAEDFTILDPQGRVRPNFRPRPHPTRVAGVPLGFHTTPQAVPPSCRSFELLWDARPELGETEVFVPSGLYPPDAGIVASPGVTWVRDVARQCLTCRSLAPGPCRIRMIAHP